VGADAFVAKPLKPDDLIRVLGRTVARTSIAPPAPG
jgi:hypothetical protein